MSVPFEESLGAPADAVATSSDAEPGGAGAAGEGRPAGFTAAISGEEPGVTNDPDEARALNATPELEHGSDLEGLTPEG